MLLYEEARYHADVSIAVLQADGRVQVITPLNVRSFIKNIRAGRNPPPELPWLLPLTPTTRPTSSASPKR